MRKFGLRLFTLAICAAAALWAWPRETHATTTAITQFVLKDEMGIYDFPEELVSYDVAFPAGSATASHLKLTDAAGAAIEYQLSNVAQSGGYLTSATVSFRTGLAKLATKTYALVQDTDYTPSFTDHVTLTDNGDHTATLSANFQQIKVPYGSVDYSAVALSGLNAPIIAYGREAGTLIGAGSFVAPAAATASRVTGEVLEDGPLYLKYRVSYSLTGGKSYAVVLTVRHNEKYVAYDESLSGLTEADGVSFKLSYKNGVDPNGRISFSNGGYGGTNWGSNDGYAAAYGYGVDAAGKLPVNLGLYSPNTGHTPRSISLWKDDGDNGLIFSEYRLADWKTSVRYSWDAADKPENLYFYDYGGDKYMLTKLVGTERHWAFGVLPRSEMVVAGISANDAKAATVPAPRMYTLYSDFKAHGQAIDFTALSGADQFGSAPDAKLFAKLSDFSLDRYKDLTLDWNEALTPYETGGTAYTYAQFWTANRNNFRGAALVHPFKYWDYFNAGFLNYEYANQWLIDYANSRSGWTEAQRKQVRAILAFMLGEMTGDNGLPQHSMMGGHPNFIMSFKKAIPIGAYVFKDHPDAKQWRDDFMSFWEEWLSVYTRQANTALNAAGGRWLENVGNYWPASLVRANVAAVAMQKYDGTLIYDNPVVTSLMDWTIDTIADVGLPNRGVIPMGAHTYGVGSIYESGERMQGFYDTAVLMSGQGLIEGKYLLYRITKGKEGVAPPVHASKLYNDYGPVLWYDFGGPNEAFVTLQTLYGSGYRWGVASNGQLYYSAGGKNWSWNTPESNGDALDIAQLSVFDSGGARTLSAHAVDGVLYDFDFAQYYKAAAMNNNYNNYLSRSVMMVKNKYLAVYDDMNNTTQNGTFYWNNNSSRAAKMDYYNDTTFTNLYYTTISGARFEVDMAGDKDSDTLPPGIGSSYSIRWTSKLKAPASGTFQFYNSTVGAANQLKIWVGGTLVYNSVGNVKTNVALTAGAEYDFKAEYVHNSGAPFAGKTNYTNGTNTYELGANLELIHYFDAPAIQTVKDGPGDELHIVEPRTASAYTITSKTYGAKLGNEYVIDTDTTANTTDGSIVINGKVAYANAGELALFDGTKVGYGDFVLERSGGSFGVSAKLASSYLIEGRYAGTSGGTVKVTLPAGFATAKLKVTANGVVVPAALSGRTVTFAVAVAQSDGTKRYTISSGTELAQGKTILASGSAAGHGAALANNGNTADYWEGSAAASTLTVDLGASYAVDAAVLKLPAGWAARTQTLTVQGSADNTTFADLAASAAYSFDPTTGNAVAVTLSGAATRYVKLVFTGNSATAGKGQIAELQVWSHAAGTELAAGKTTAASGSASGHDATLANNGNAADYWESAANPATLTVDLGAAANVGAVAMKLPAGWSARTQTLSIQGSADNTTYADLAASAVYAFDPAQSNTVTVCFATANVRYVRLQFTSNSASPHAQMGELQIY
ncbi:discoidin domain-containing protein [Cohnella sp. GCM10020058]|uniref:galactose-binding domain-containing protein n=1 Tax=Cohnella sp. GCM10020058 TaxID=3317330 RepID=UPI003636D6FF